MSNDTTVVGGDAVEQTTETGSTPVEQTTETNTSESTNTSEKTTNPSGDKGTDVSGQHIPFERFQEVNNRLKSITS